MIEASLVEFLRDGLVAGVGLHMSRAAVRAALGDPDFLADYRPQDSLPMLWRYGELNVGFSRADDRVFFIQIFPRLGPGRLRWRSGSGSIIKVSGTPETMSSYLDEQGLTYTIRRSRRSAVKLFTQGGVVLTFSPFRLKEMFLGVTDVERAP